VINLAEYDWILAIGLPIVFAIGYFMIDENNSGLVIFAFLNIGLGIMVYAGLAEVWQLILCMITTVVLVYMGRKRGASL